ncbi:hypothetical protein L3X38_045018 [Prunus dulcis]|uniref:Uncharacterized protein n=1 Tax=Prunus dulcis TaxID=3755 RepID=A0AAD4V1V1_PRUDU|nr:hypothetical protein L3X38_045018 [Prunus dulcis]
MDRIPDADMLRSMKTLNVVIQESLRLYPLSLIVVRQGLEDIDLNNIQIPKGTNIEIPIPILQQLPDIRRPNALDFNPNLRHLVCKSRPFSTGPVGIKIAL